MNISTEQESLIEKYLEEILEVNKTINLTRIDNWDSAKILHLEDSLSILDDINNAPEGLYADLGSGGGFPGVPIAIASGRETLLVDSVSKKMNAVSDVLQKLNITNIKTYDKRIEELAIEEPEAFAVVSARALSNLSSLLELASPLLKQGGLLVCMKANVDEDELNKSIQLEEKLGMKLISERKFTLSDGETNRTILIYKKIGSSKIKLPRKIGMAQKKPLN